MIKNGRPYTLNHSICDQELHIDDSLFTDLSEDMQVICKKWVEDNIVSRKTKNDRHSSYGIKHDLERDTGIYMTNNQFKDLMLICGYQPVDPNEVNWFYRISEKSPAFSRPPKA